MEVSKLTDEQLVLRLSVEGAFEELYTRHVGKVTSFATRRCSTPHEIPDLVAAVWLEVIASASSLDPRRGRAVPWILGVAAKLTASNERRHAREREAVERLGRQLHVEEEAIAELERQLDAAIPARQALLELRKLPLGERLIAELVMVEGLRASDAAQALGIKSATARMRLLRARKKLQKALGPFRPVTDDLLPLSEV